LFNRVWGYLSEQYRNNFDVLSEDLSSAARPEIVGEVANGPRNVRAYYKYRIYSFERRPRLSAAPE
jgi:hypothetical protein